MTLKELGEALRQKREACGISLKDAEKRTKIAARILSSIEEGRQDNFPHPVYAKGFVKTYARLLDIDPEEAGAVIDSELGLPEDDENTRPPQLIVQRRKSYAPLVVLAIVVLLLGAGGYFMYAKFSAPVAESSQPETSSTPAAVESEPSKPEPKPEEPAAESTGAESSVPVVSEPESVEAVEAVSPVAAPVAAEVAAEPTLQEEKAEEVAPQVPEEAAVAPEPVQSAPVSAPVVAGTQALKVTASLDCWIEARMDDARDQELFLRSGKSFTFRFDESLAIKLGNGGGVTLALNGKRIPVSAKPGEVVTLHFPQQ